MSEFCLKKEPLLLYYLSFFIPFNFKLYQLRGCSKEKSDCLVEDHGLDWNISRTIGFIVRKFWTDIHVPERMSPRYFPLRSPWGSYLWYCIKCLDNISWIALKFVQTFTQPSSSTTTISKSVFVEYFFMVIFYGLWPIA